MGDVHKSEYIKMDGYDLAKAVEAKDVSPEELVELSFEQLDSLNEQLNITTSTRKERALSEAKKLQHTTNSPFLGVPILMKSISQAVKGEPLTAGAKLLKDVVADGDSNFVKRIRKAGFIFTGHTNTPEFALRNTTEPELNGPTRNPWNLEYSPGGSSGGAAAAVASGIVPIAGASDGGGSIRIPASFTSLFGLKPTRGRTPVGPGVGRQWQGAAIDFVLTRSVRDAALILDCLQIVQEEAAFQTPLYPGSFYEASQREIKRPIRIGYSTKSPVGTPVSEEARRAVNRALEFFQNMGAEIEETEPAINGEEVMKNYFLMNSGEMAKVITGFEQRLGREVTLDDIEPATWLLQEAGRSVSAVEFSKSLSSWDEAAYQMMKYHQTYDLYITPATAFPAPQIGEFTISSNQQEELLERMNQATTSEVKQAVIWDMFLPSFTYTPFTQLANLTGQPAVSVPLYLTEDGLPLGVQMMARKGEEVLLLQIARLMEESDIWLGMKGNPCYQ